MSNEEIVKENTVTEEKAYEMDAQAKIDLLENRLQVLTARGKDNRGVCRRIERDIRNLRKKL